MTERRTPPPYDPFREQVELLRRFAHREAQRAQTTANRLIVITSHLDLLLSELREAAHVEAKK